MHRLVLLLAIPIILSGGTAIAGGFQILEHGASSTGMANARTALADDVNTLYFNPAGITELPGLQFQLGVTGILPLITYDAAGNPEQIRTYPSYENGSYIFKEVNDGLNDVDAKLKGFNPIHLYASYNLEDLGLAVGFGLNNPFGLGTYWPGDWDGRFIGTETEIQTFFNQPTLSVDLAQLLGFKDSFKLSAALSYVFVYATARLAKKIDLRAAEAPSQGSIIDPEGEMRMLGSAIGHGFNASVYGELPDTFAFGFTVRSGIALPFSGTAKFSFNEPGIAAVDFLHLAIPDQTGGKLQMDLPWNLNFGLAYLGVENLKLAVDVYASFFESYKALELKFACINEGTCSDTLDAGPIEKNWGTSYQFSVGAEYRLLGVIPIRAGYGLVTSPVPDGTYDPALPDGRRNLLAFGIGYIADWYKLDLGYMLAMWQGTKDNQVGEGDNNNPEGKANGTYVTQTHILALSLSAWF